MCVATMYQVGIERLFYAGAASDSSAFFQRLANIENMKVMTVKLNTRTVRGCA